MAHTARCVLLWLVCGLLFACSSTSTSSLEPAPADLDLYDVVWNSPSRDASGSMPIGNGEVGLNVWVEAGGDLLFYVARTDSWSEAARLLKLARVRVQLKPNPFLHSAGFEQRLRLRDGRIEIAAGAVGDRWATPLTSSMRPSGGSGAMNGLQRSDQRASRNSIAASLAGSWRRATRTGTRARASARRKPGLKPEARAAWLQAASRKPCGPASTSTSG
jgi:hypothetical protein